MSNITKELLQPDEEVSLNFSLKEYLIWMELLSRKGDPRGGAE